jgi:hypothetical protein
MDKEFIFNYKDIGGNVFARKNIKIEDQIFELLNTYYGITKKEFDFNQVELEEIKE